MDSFGKMRAVKAERGITEVGIKDMNREKALLLGVNDRWYCEIVESIWAEWHVPDAGVVYLQTMSHGGGICLRPLFVEVDGEWLNASSGVVAPHSLDLPLRMKCNSA